MTYDPFAYRDVADAEVRDHWIAEITRKLSNVGSLPEPEPTPLPKPEPTLAERLLAMSSGSGDC